MGAHNTGFTIVIVTFLFYFILLRLFYFMALASVPVWYSHTESYWCCNVTNSLLKYYFIVTKITVIFAVIPREAVTLYSNFNIFELLF